MLRTVDINTCSQKVVALQKKFMGLSGNQVAQMDLSSQVKEIPLVSTKAEVPDLIGKI
ncbi:hypothetical protein PC128_g13948 [Phytophthora cactorum]|nr:hypothetical protein PC128_g13948 [Phytophthora cactorum]